MNHLDKKLSEKILPEFLSAKEWSDLMAILKKLKENLKKYGSFNLAKTTEKVVLAKRLAQSLNPSLPGGLHEISLEVYDIIFENIRANNSNMMGNDLGLYSSGLFPFFQFSNVQNKTLYLNKIIRKHYLELTDQELNICLPGFLVSILPGLDDQNEALLKNIKEIFTKTREKVGDSNFFGVLWTVILRTQRMRLVGMKYIAETIPLYKIIEKEEANEDLIRKYYPNLHVLVINSLTSVIEDESVHVQRLGLDFIITRFPINNKILKDEEKIPMIISSLNLLIKNDYSTTRRLFAWLLGSQEEELEMTDPSINYMIELLTISIKRIFDYKNFNVAKLSNGLKIIDQLFKQQVKLVYYILGNISIDLISCIEQYFHSGENLNFTNDDILGKVKKFFDYDASYTFCLWNSLGDLLFNAVSKSNESMPDVNWAIKLLKFCLIHIRLYSIDKMIIYYIPIVSSLLKALLNFKISNRSLLGEIKPLLVLALKFTHEMLEANQISNKSNPEETKKKKIRHCIQSLNILNERNYSMMETFKENIISFQYFYIQLCKILIDGSNDGINKNDLKLFKTATELILNTQLYCQQDSLPEWIHYLIKIVFCQEIEFSLEGINYLLDLLMMNSDNEVYLKIKNYLRSENLNDVKFLNNFSNSHFFQSSVQRNCCELSMSKLWLLLEEQGFQKKVIDLLIKFHRAETVVFSNTISNTFSINDIEQNVNAIKKFSQFWKLTSEYYPEITFFENGECIFKMLDFLDNDHPLLRHLSKSWLSQSVGEFNKILDPLLKVLLDKETKWYITYKKQLYFSEEYDARRIIEAFRKLKNIIINMTDVAINYFVNTPISAFLIEMDTLGAELSSISNYIPMESYLEMMASISLRFIQGKFIESVSKSLYRENFSVNAASCEFLEFLLSFIEPKSKVMKIADLIAKPVLMILHESIMSNDEVMQVQLLNLLKVLLFNTQMVHKDFIPQAMNIFNSQVLHDCITLGIQINYIFVRSHFISFVEYCLPIFRDILNYESNLGIAQKLIITTSDFLVKRVKYLGNLQVKDNIIENEKISHLVRLPQIDIQTDTKFFIIKNYLEGNKGFKVFDENDLNLIIKGLKEMIFHFLSIENPIASQDKIKWCEYKKILNSKSSPISIREFLNKLFTNKNFEDNTSRNNYIEMSNSIFGIFEEVLASFICCWVNESSKTMTIDLCLNENGILGSSNEEIKLNNLNENNNCLNLSPVKPVKNSKVIRSQLVNINLNLFLSNPFEFMKKFISLWLNETNKYVYKDKQYKLSMIELLVELNVPFDVILMAAIKNIEVNKIKDYKKSKVKVKDVQPYFLNKDQITYEAKICQFIYSFIVYNCNPILDKLSIDIWNEMINFFKIFMESKSPITFFWLFEILNIMLQKFPLRDVQSEKIKNKLITISTNLFVRVMEFSVNNKIDVIFEDSGKLIFPMNPSIYEKVAIEIYGKDIFNMVSVKNRSLSFSQNQKISMQSAKHEKFNMVINEGILQTNEANLDKVSDESIRTFYRNLYNYTKDETILKNDQLLIVYRNIGFITLKSLFYSTMKNIYLNDKSDKLIAHIQLLVKNLISLMNDRTGNNKIYIDLATEFLHSLMKRGSAMTSNSCKNMIMEFFLEPEFFNMSNKCLRLWREIISEFARFYQDIIVDLFNRLNNSSFFSKGNDKLKIIALRRVSFILYASQKDVYSSKLISILEKVKEVITTYSENPPLEAEIFLMIRIMFLRFSSENLVEMLRYLWPIIFSELVNIITAKKKNNPLDLDLSSLKLIEEMSLANMEEFCLYQWIFLIDSYDVNIMHQENEINLINPLVNSESRIFKPFQMELIKDMKKNPDLFLNIQNMKNSDCVKRGLIVQTQKLNSKEELSNYVSRLFLYITLMNNFRTNIDWDIVENLIEGDFLNAAI